jgi:hypothetical protein
MMFSVHQQKVACDKKADIPAASKATRYTNYNNSHSSTNIKEIYLARTVP